MVAFVILWLRMAVHYLSQYILLKAMNAPVIDVELYWYKIKLVYTYSYVSEEMAVVACGPVSNSIIFLILVLVCHLSQKYIFCFPVSFCKYIAWYGIATMFDFFLVAVIDFAIQDWTGDLFKLYIYYNTAADGSGFVGYFLTFVM